MELFKNSNIPFVSNRFKAYIFSGFMILTSVVLFAVIGLNYGVDFVGGTSIEVRFRDAVELEKVRSIVSGKFVADRVQNFGSPNDILIHVLEQRDGIDKEIVSLLEKNLQNNPVELRSVSQVGPKIGSELKTSAIWATIWGLIFISFILRSASSGNGAWRL